MSQELKSSEARLFIALGWQGALQQVYGRSLQSSCSTLSGQPLQKPTSKSYPCLLSNLLSSNGHSSAGYLQGWRGRPWPAGCLSPQRSGGAWSTRTAGRARTSPSRSPASPCAPATPAAPRHLHQRHMQKNVTTSAEQTVPIAGSPKSERPQLEAAYRDNVDNLRSSPMLCIQVM